MMRTYVTKPAEVQRKWYVVDAQGQTLGRLAARVATILRGKHKPIFMPGVDCGDFVIVVNADKIKVTGRRLEQKKYYRHSGYPGGLYEVGLQEQLTKHPTRPVVAAVRGMLPKNRLGRKQLKMLKVYAGAEHPHQAQLPEALEL